MARVNWAAPLALLLATGLVACGDDNGGGDSEGDDFVSQANALCSENATQFQDIALDVGYEFEIEDRIEGSERRLAVRQDTLASFEDLEPPADQSEAFNDYLAAREENISLYEEQLSALEDNDEEKAAELSARASEGADEIQSMSTDLGFEVCDGELPEDEAAAAEDVIREFETTADPATSCSTDGLVTETMLEEGLRGEEKCTALQDRIGDELPEDIEMLEKTTGIEGATATVNFEWVGGPDKGYAEKPRTATLYYLDGEWKIYTAGLAE